MKRSALFPALIAAAGKDDTREYATSCRFCNVGCGYRVLVGRHLKPQSPDLPVVTLPDGKFVELVPDAACPVNQGDYSVRGAFLSESLYTGGGPTSDRLLHPMVRVKDRLVRASWDDALDLVGTRLKGYLERYGPESLGLYHADWFGGENAYAYMKLAKMLGIKNYDISGRLCAASGAAGLMRSLGNGTHPWALEDIEHAETIVLAGANASASLSAAYDRVFARAQSGGAKLIVVDVRRTLPARNAGRYGMFLEIRPGTDVALYNAIGNVLIAEGLVDRAFVDAHTADFDTYRAFVAQRYTPERAAQITGLTAEQIRQAARTIGQSKATLFLSGKGLEHQAHGVDMICSFINLALVTGNMGKPGGSYSPLGGHQGSIVNPPLFAGQLGDVTIPNRTIFQMYDQIERGTQKALLLASVQQIVNFPDADRFRSILSGKLEFLVVTDIYPNDVTALADVVFPAASWGETPFTSTNTERRVRFYEAFAPVPGEARPDWVVPAELGKRMGYAKEFGWKDAEQIFDEMKTGQPFAGLTYARMRASKSTNYQMPVPTAHSEGTVRLYTDGRFPTPDGRAKIWALEYLPQPEPPSRDYPFTLVTGRANDNWQSGYIFSRTPQLVARLPRNYVRINPGDAHRLGVQDGKTVRVRTRRGSIDIVARVTDNVPPGVIFTLWGYPDSLTNVLTINVRDPISQTPCYKACAASVERV
ncbi:MAG: molybdopterin oxidoreductase family protein [Vulcanimicrobiaceae bacterium]